MATQTICTTCERTTTSATCDACDFATPRTPIQVMQASATTPLRPRHRNDLPFSRTSFDAWVAANDTNHDLFV